MARPWELAEGLTVWQAGVTSELRALGLTLDVALIGQLRTVVRGGPTTESELHRLWESADGWARALEGQIAGSERRLQALGREDAPRLGEVTRELRRLDTLRPQLDEVRGLMDDLEQRARELRAAWVLDGN
jgi:hypothetical protein